MKYTRFFPLIGLFTRRSFDRTGMTTSETVLDYGLVDQRDEGLVSTFIIDENNRYGISSDHSTLFMSIRMDGPASKVKWSIKDRWCDIKDNTDWTKFAEATNKLSMDEKLFETMTAEDKLNHIRSVMKKGWLKSGNRKNKGRGRAKRGNRTGGLIKRLEFELFALKKRGLEQSEEFRKLASRIEGAIQADMKRKREAKEMKERENDELFIRSDPTGIKFFDFVR